MTSDVKQVTFFAKKPRCPKCQCVKGTIMRIETSVFEEETHGEKEEDSFLLQDITIECQCGTTYEAKYLSLPLANMEIKIVDHQKEEEVC